MDIINYLARINVIRVINVYNHNIDYWTTQKSNATNIKYMMGYLL